MDWSALTAKFESFFGVGELPAVVRAPGRVNLIGEHTDYNGGFVLPIAIEKQTVALVRPRADVQIVLRSTGAQGEGSVGLSEWIAPGEPKWANYCLGVIAGLKDRGLRLVGADILFDSDIPIGGGLSSSASLEVATALAVQTASGTVGTVPPRELALLCQKAENTFAGAPCGIMDQSVVVMAQAGTALLLDCRSGQTRYVPFDNPNMVLLVCDTQVRHDIGEGGYGVRRSQCESAAAKLGLPTLRDASAESVARCTKLSDVERMRVRHVIGEIARTTDATAALGAGDYDGFGKLMYASHQSLRDDYQVSCEELDAIVETARNCPGVYGARMTGGGFGGCAIVLVEARRGDDVAQAIAVAFADRFGRRCPISLTRAAGGASVVG
ncbi:MAG: galactokinase [Planctomycetes bacterium]|nr:galactokinase [Planctomycetota bacterium]